MIATMTESNEEHTATACCSLGRRFGVLLLLAALVAGGLTWQMSLRTHAGPASGTVLAGASATQTTRQTLRVGTFNIHGGKGRDGKMDLDRIAAELKDLDIVGLNEVHADRSGESADQAAALGERLQMPYLFAPTERRWGAESFGNGLLCSPPVKHYLRIPLKSTKTKGLRNMLLATIDWAGRDVRVLITHIDTRIDRESQLASAIAMFLSLQPPAILMGDLNTAADDQQIQTLLATEGVVDVAAGIVRPKQRERIDWIITRGLQTVTAEVRENDASDHPVIRAELR